MIVLSAQQMELARHALGLDSPYAQGKSYRNRFYCQKRSGHYADWQSMVEQGMAEERKEGKLQLFTLTRLGADCVLNDGETLCPEDFPPSERG